MQTVLVTIDCPGQSIDLKLPAETPLQELLPFLLHACELAPDIMRINPADWVVARTRDETVLPYSRSLASCGIIDGMRLRLQDQASWNRQKEAERAANLATVDVPASDKTGGIGIRFRRDDLLSNRRSQP